MDNNNWMLYLFTFITCFFIGVAITHTESKNNDLTASHEIEVGIVELDEHDRTVVRVKQPSRTIHMTQEETMRLIEELQNAVEQASGE